MDENERERMAREALGGSAKALLGASYERTVGRIAGAIDVAVAEEAERLRAAAIEECATEIERVALQHDTVVCASLAKHLRKMKRR
jgi:hypothetical protein